MSKKTFIFHLFFLTTMGCLAESATEYDSPYADGVAGGHEYVDLGLPGKTLWATCNIGCSVSSEAGEYFAWGETESRKSFSWEDYRFCIGFDTDGGNSDPILEDIGEDICSSEYDVAKKEWGDGWRLPSYDDVYELMMFCWNEWTSEDGVKGIKVHGPNEKTIFLPASGEGCLPENMWGYYWTGTGTNTYGSDGSIIEPSRRAIAFWVDSSGLQSGDALRYVGMNVRPVRSADATGAAMMPAGSEFCNMTYIDGMLRISAPTGHYSVRISDLSGRTILHFADRSEIDLSDFNTGVYLVAVTLANSMTSTLKVAVR